MEQLEPLDNPLNAGPFPNQANSSTIGTQTENSSNNGQELRPLKTQICQNPFDKITFENSPNYLIKTLRAITPADQKINRTPRLGGH